MKVYEKKDQNMDDELHLLAGERQGFGKIQTLLANCLFEILLSAFVYKHQYLAYYALLKLD